MRSLGQFAPLTSAGGLLWATFPGLTVRALDPRTGIEVPTVVSTTYSLDRAVIANGWLYLTDGRTLRAFTVPGAVR